MSGTAGQSLTAILPVRIDSPDRTRNLQFALHWLASRIGPAETIVVEHDAQPTSERIVEDAGAHYVFIESDGCFHKSRAFNVGVALAQTPVVLLYDCDAAASPAGVASALDLILGDRADVVYPYNGVGVDLRTTAEAPGEIEKAVDGSGLYAPGSAVAGDPSDTLPPNTAYFAGSADEPCTGLACLAHRRRFVLAGGFNERIASYGCEDMEMDERMRKLGLRVERVADYNCVHLYHRRGIDSRYNNFHAANLAEWRKVQSMERDELARYVRNGFRSMRMDPKRHLSRTDEPDCETTRLYDDEKRLDLSDTALIMPLSSTDGVPPDLLARFVDELELAYRDYELHVVDISKTGAPRLRGATHRNHVIYTAVQHGVGPAFLETMIEATERRVIVFCNPSVDLGPQALPPALADLREGSASAVAPRAVDSSDDTGTARTGSNRALELAGRLRRRLAAKSRPRAFDRDRLLAWTGELDARSEDAWNALVERAFVELSGGAGT